jgi:arylsulfatase A-like enzyme
VKLSRRSFIKALAAPGALAGAACSITGPRRSERPNILFLITDQQSATMMSTAGNRWLKTPAMDGLAGSGVRFERAYCTDPVCLPSRFSFLTGRYPSAVGVRHNGSKPTELVNSMPQKAMGHLFRAAGYETVYGGKVHLPGPMKDITTCGFDVLTNNQREGLADGCVRYLRQQHEKPFLMVASFINPHDICYMAIRDYDRKIPRVPPPLDEALKLPAGVSREEFFEKHCPPLPSNFEIPKDEPDAITWLIKLRPFRQNARENWSKEKWRLHRWAYCRLTERVDAQLGQVLTALRETGLEENTLVILTADHGDMDSSHRLEHKTVFYEQAANIPMVVRAPGPAAPGRVEREHMVSNGLDLIPTMCDYAGIETPAGLQGRSLRPLVEGRTPNQWRETLFIESQIGYMVTDGRYKYSAFDPDKGARRESLVDLKTDPGEMENLAGEASERDTVQRLRTAMADWQRQNGIDFEMPS